MPWTHWRYSIQLKISSESDGMRLSAAQKGSFISQNSLFCIGARIRRGDKMDWGNCSFGTTLYFIECWNSLSRMFRVNVLYLILFIDGWSWTDRHTAHYNHLSYHICHGPSWSQLTYSLHWSQCRHLTSDLLLIMSTFNKTKL